MKFNIQVICVSFGWNTKYLYFNNLVETFFVIKDKPWNSRIRSKKMLQKSFTKIMSKANSYD
jgi:hypothetical protein